MVNSSFFFRRNTGDQNVSTNPLPTDEDNVPAPSGGDSQFNGQSAMRTTFIRLK